LVFVWKNFGLKTLLCIAPIFVLNEFLVGLFAIKERWFLLKLKSYWEALLLLPSILRMRAKIKTLRIKPDRLLKRYLSPEASFSEISLPLTGFYNKILKKIYENLN